MKRDEFSVNIAPEMEMYGILKSLRYTAETAFAEFIDNSIQSFIDTKIPASENNHISIKISKDEKTIVIEDNAGGIDREHLQTALKPTGLMLQGRKHKKDSLSVYGIGLKSAAIWFSETWMLETSSKGSDLKYVFNFDLPELLREGKEEAMVVAEDEKKDASYTKITIKNNTRIADFDTYANRVVPFILETFHKFSKIARISFEIDGNEVIPAPKRTELTAPNHLVYPPVLKNERIEKPCLINWRTNLDFPYKGRQIKGFFMIREKGSYEQPGIRLLRNKRVIEGTSVYSNTPKEILGTKNKYSAQRLYAELHLDDFEVDFMKTTFTEDLTPLYKKLNKILKEEFNVDFVNQVNSLRPTKATIEEKELIKRLKEEGIYAEIGISSEELKYDPLPKAEEKDESSGDIAGQGEMDLGGSGENAQPPAGGGASNDNSTVTSENGSSGNSSDHLNPTNSSPATENAGSNGPIKITKIVKNSDPNKIVFSDEAANLIIKLDSDKLIDLASSLQNVVWTTNPILITVGVWAFWETICKQLGAQDGTSIDHFLNPKIDAWYGKKDARRKPMKDAIEDIRKKGNCAKHSLHNFNKDASNLNPYMKELDPVLIKCLELLIEEKNTKKVS